MIRVRPPPRPTQPSAESAGDMHERACPGIQTLLISDTTIRIQSTGDPVRHRHHVVSVRAGAVQPLEDPGAYARVPRRVLGRDGQIRPWTPAAPSTPGTHDPGNEPRVLPVIQGERGGVIAGALARIL